MTDVVELTSTVRPTRPVSVRERTVTEVQYRRGRGIPGDPVRIVFAYYDPDGNLLAERDTWQDDDLEARA